MKYVRATIMRKGVRGLLVSEEGRTYLLNNTHMGTAAPYLHNYKYSLLMLFDSTSNKYIYTSEKHKLIADRLILYRKLRRHAPMLADKMRDMTGQFLSISQDDESKISYANDKRFKYDNQRRTKTSFQRYVRRQMGISKDIITDQELDEIKWAVFGSAGAKPKFKTLKGEDIVAAYSDEIGGSSCMTGDDSDKVQIYADNDNVSLLVCNNQYRALLWECDDGTKVLDRIYPNAGDHVGWFHEYAKANGIVYRMHNHMPDGNVELSDEQFHRVTLRHDDVFPYIDTFHYGSIDGSEVELSNESCFGDIHFSCTEGGHSETQRCDRCGASTGGDFIESHGDMYCEYCRNEHLFCCDRCGDWEPVESCREIDSCCWCDYCTDHWASWCDKCETYTTEGTVECADMYYCDTCRDDYLTLCEKCDSYTLNDEVTVVDDEYWCNDCASGAYQCENCGEIHAEIKETEDGEYICDECGEECPECGGWIKDECNECIEQQQEEDAEEYKAEPTGEEVSANDRGNHGQRDDIREQRTPLLIQGQWGACSSCSPLRLGEASAYTLLLSKSAQRDADLLASA